MGTPEIDIDEIMWEFKQGFMDFGRFKVMWDFTGGMTKEEYKKQQIRERGEEVVILKDGRVLMPQCGLVY